MRSNSAGLRLVTPTRIKTERSNLGLYLLMIGAVAGGALAIWRRESIARLVERRSTIADAIGDVAAQLQRS